MLRRLLVGERQKSVAADVGKAVATIAAGYSECLHAITHERKLRDAPPLLVMAAHAASGFVIDAELGVTLSGASAFDVETKTPDAWVQDSLTKAEREVLRALLCGKACGEIARLRGRATRTVANQLTSVFRKLGVSGRAELVSRLIRGGGPSALTRVACLHVVP